MNDSILHTVHDIYLLIRKNLIFVLKFSIGFLFLGIIYTLFSTKYYESYISINPQDHESQSANSFKAISSVMGLDANEYSNSTFHIPDVINSRKLKLDIVNKNWKTRSFQDSVNLLEYWNLEGEPDSKLNINPRRFAEEDAINKLSNSLYVFEEESGLIKIRVLMEEPQLAADIANYISDFLRNYIGKELTLKSTKYREFIESRLEEVGQDLESAENILAKFETENPESKDNPDLKKKRRQLNRNILVQDQIYVILIEQHQRALADELMEKPVSDLLDIADTMPYPYWPNNIIIYIISLFTGFMISIIIITTSKALSKKS